MSPRAVLLSQNGQPRWTGIALTVLMIALAGWIESCATLRHAVHLDEKGDDVLKFSHAKHAQYVHDCNACHLSKKEGTIGPAKHSACVACHPAAVDNKPADQSCLLCHHTLTPKKSRRAERPDYSKASFDHANHVSVNCAVCHGQVDKSGPFAKVNYPRMEECLACHSPALGQPSAADCATCHSGITLKTVPADHKQFNWTEHLHGQASQNDPALCLRCHEPAKDCQTCHSMDLPKSHTASFRAKTHGFHARDNPKSCETCHAQDFCESCHRTTEPMNHTVSFKGRPYLHCVVCHIPLEDGNECSVCHRGNPHEHLVADPPPAYLIASGQIRLDRPCLPCHPVALVPITHPYNTISPLECILCHRPP